MMKKVVNIVIGGAGFIGTHLIHKLKKEGELAFSIDKEEFNFKKERTDFIIDILDADKKFLADCFSSYTRNFNGQITGTIKVWHCSSVVGVVAYKTEDTELLNKSISMNSKIFESMVYLEKYTKSLFFHVNISLNFLSTSELYGNGDEGIIDENTPVSLNTFSGFRNFYVLQKYFAELQYKSLSQITNIQVKVFRLFNVVGVGQRKEAGVIPKIINQMLSEKEELIMVKPDDSYGRSYLPVDYAVSQLYDLSIYSSNFIENIFSGFYISDNDLIKLIVNCVALNTESEVELKDPVIIEKVEKLEKADLIKDFGKNKNGAIKVFHLPEEDNLEIKMRYFNNRREQITKEEIIENSKYQKYDRLIHKVINDIIMEQTNADR